MKDSDIIKALECCSGIDKCIDCPYTTINDCAKQNAKDVIDLINRQKAEIERLKGWQDLLKAEKHSLIKSEAIKEFIAEFERRCIDGGIYPAFVKRQLEHVKAEMVGE